MKWKVRTFNRCSLPLFNYLKFVDILQRNSLSKCCTANSISIARMSSTNWIVSDLLIPPTSASARRAHRHILAVRIKKTNSKPKKKVTERKKKFIKPNDGGELRKLITQTFSIHCEKNQKEKKKGVCGLARFAIKGNKIEMRIERCECRKCIISSARSVTKNSEIYTWFRRFVRSFAHQRRQCLYQMLNCQFEWLTRLRVIDIRFRRSFFVCVHIIRISEHSSWSL